ncbi:hypothetical protein AVEN_130219-1 [Araneus ventricosus]|uniref:Uncharacterized protein n=1 Tax=Araneus ventricosus TaxID=182803 RepID=A0A4Y2GFP2_ARAVE|nr:hypothetical protein AVEN_130219-1 [Araneus ventricosus]
MTRVEPFGKLAERFSSQQETRFPARFLIRLPQAFITSLFQAFHKVVKIHPSEDKMEPPSEAALLQRGPTPICHPLFKAVLLQRDPTPFFSSHLSPA